MECINANKPPQEIGAMGHPKLLLYKGLGAQTQGSRSSLSSRAGAAAWPSPREPAARPAPIVEDGHNRSRVGDVVEKDRRPVGWDSARLPQA